MEDTIRALNVKRGILKRTLTNFENYLKDIDQESNSVDKQVIKSLAKRVNQIQPLLEECVTITVDLTCAQIENEEQHSNELTSFQERYYAAMTISEIILENNPQVNNEYTHDAVSVKNDESRVVVMRKPNITLPTINLPIFDGTFMKWREFKDKFTSLIHNNEDLTDTEKFTYLKSSLKGEPSELLSSLNTTDANYKIAWDRLESRYDNKRRIINNHVNELLNIPSINRESHQSLRNLIIIAQNHVDCLKTFDVPVHSWDALLIPILTQKLDAQTCKEWESKLNNVKGDNMPTFTQFIEFLNIKQNTLETFYARNKCDTTIKQNTRETRSLNATQTNVICPHCKGSHLIITCESFLKLEAIKRNERVRELKLCLNCLRKGHYIQECESKWSCKTCKRRHHTLIHLNEQIVSPQSDTNIQKNTVDKPKTTQTTIATHATETNISTGLLSTAKVLVYKNQTSSHKTLRALLDQGSQSHFITHKVCKELNLKLEPVNIQVKGIMNVVKSGITHRTSITIKSCCNRNTFEISCLVVDQITSNLPTNSFKIVDIPKNIKLADPMFNIPSPIDLLIGAGLFYELLCVGQIKQQNKLVYQKTKLGWVAAGNIYDTQADIKHTGLILNDLHKQVEEFWQLDQLNDEKRKFTPEEVYCEELFKDTTTRDAETGKFMVKIPIKTKLLDKLGDSKMIAHSRLMSMENRLSKNTSLRKDYNKFMLEYINLGHMTRLETIPDKCFVLPHHAVFKPDSESTKIRIVFDGSCKPDEGMSINDIQFVGPTIQQELTSIIARFRTHKYVLTADITKMYRQVLIHPDDRKFQLIYWRFNTQDKIDCYELNTVTYGTAAAPFLAIRSLQQLSIEHKDKYPVESRIIEEDFYVDDMLSGGKTIEELKVIKENIQQILNSAGFSLAKWNSNTRDLLNNDTSHEQDKIELTEKLHKTLGIFWHPLKDSFCYSTKTIRLPKQISKRTILATTAQLFDPLGLLAPTIMYVKMLLQEIWKSKITWDESLSYDLQSKWFSFQNKIHSLNHLNIPRHVLIDNCKQIEIHVFSDASKRGYGACMYLRSSNGSDAKTCLLAAKSRVTPKKLETIARLELCAALLAARLVNKYKPILNLNITRTYYWSDSQIVIAWINAEPSRFNTFVANRITDIQSLSNPQDWYYVKSEDNPADLISRGKQLPHQMLDLTLWWNGPPGLNKNLKEMTSYKVNSKVQSNLQETKQKCTVLSIQTCINTPDITRYSSILRLNRIVAYVLRFLTNSETRIKGPLTTHEIHEAHIKIIKIIQRECFGDEINILITSQEIPKTSKIISLSPFLDSQGLLRVGGRIKLSNFPYDKKHPIIIPKTHHITQLIFKQTHLDTLHAGPNFLLHSIREKYWPINGRNIARQTVRNCVTCTRYQSQVTTQLMGNLPRERTLVMYPFHSVGVDFGGPFLVKDTKRRGSKLSKAYLCLFVCFSTRALHLELISDLTTNAFIATLRRFIARRGTPKTIFSDNGTTFVGAKKELSNLYDFMTNNETEIVTSASNHGIQWKFIPPYSPNFGGLWEAGIKSTKHHLKRVIGDNKFTYEEFQTFLCQIESILNSRPLYPLTSNPNDLEALTPAHFLIGRTFQSMADPDVCDIPISRLDRYQHIQRLSQHFWKQWSLSYIGELQQRTKWQQTKTSLRIGTMVLLKNENQPPSRWLLGRVVELHPGSDNLVRVVSVKCASGVVKRAITKVVALPENDTELTTLSGN